MYSSCNAQNLPSPQFAAQPVSVLRRRTKAIPLPIAVLAGTLLTLVAGCLLNDFKTVSLK